MTDAGSSTAAGGSSSDDAVEAMKVKQEIGVVDKKGLFLCATYKASPHF